MSLPKTPAKALEYMNQRYAVAMDSGSTVVIGRERDALLGREVLTRSSFTDITNYYNTHKLTTTEPLGKWWLEHPERRSFQMVTFAPGLEVEPSTLNLWSGFAVEPAAGDWSLFRSHIEEVIAGGDREVAGYILQWMAHAVQRPWEKPGVALVLRSDIEGVGKGMFSSWVRRLFGPHGYEVTNPQHVSGRFNAHLEDCVLLVFGEAYFNGSQQAEAVIKSLITEDTLAIERKGADLKHVQSYLRLILTSNSRWVVPASHSARRYLVLDVPPTRVGDSAYFQAINQQMENGGLSAMLHDLKRLAIDIDIRTAPRTAALNEQKIQSFEPRLAWLYGILSRGALLDDDNGWIPEVSKKAMHKEFVDSLRDSGVRRRPNETELFTFLRTVFTKGDRCAIGFSRPSIRGERVRCATFPDLDTCRDLFASYVGFKVPWIPIEDEDAPAVRSNVARMPMVRRAAS